MSKSPDEQEALWALAHEYANLEGFCTRSPEWHTEQPCETCQGLVNFARRAQPVNWEASYHQACEDADTYKAEAEKRATKLEQNWRSCQHNEAYLRERLAEASQRIEALQAELGVEQSGNRYWMARAEAPPSWQPRVEALIAKWREDLGCDCGNHDCELIEKITARHADELEALLAPPTIMAALQKSLGIEKP
jgi:hypothetical protein